MQFLLLFFTLLFMLGCGSEVALPPLKPQTTTTSFSLKPYANDVAYQDITAKKIKMPRAGEENAYLIKVSKELEFAYDNYLGGDANKALLALESADKKATSTKEHWQISFLKIKLYMLLGLDADAQAEIKQCKKYELSSFKHNYNTLALEGEIYLMEGKFEKARKNFTDILASIGTWELPTSYGLPPSNMPELVSITTAQLRSYTGMAASYVMQDKYKEAKHWAQEGEKRYNAVHYVGNHSLYGMFFHTHLDSYYGRAMNMVMLGSALLGADKDTQKSQYYFGQARKFFNTIGYEKGEIILLALKAQTLAHLGKLDEADTVALEAIKVAKKKNMYDFIWRIQTLRGKLLLQDKKIDEAELAFREASKIINLVSGDLKTDFSKRRFGVGKSDITYNLVRIGLQKKKYAQVFSDVEQARARAFVDIMRNRSVSPKNTKLLQRIRSIDKQITKLVLQNNALALTTQASSKQIKMQSADSSEILYLQKELDAIDSDTGDIAQKMRRNILLEKLEALQTKPVIQTQKTKIPEGNILAQQNALRAERNRLAQELLKKEPQSAAVVSVVNNSLQSTQQALTLDASLLYFLPHKVDEKIQALLITKDDVQLETFALSQIQLSQIMQAYLVSIGSYDNSLATNMRSFKKKYKIQVPQTRKAPLHDLHTLLPLDSIQTKRVYIVGSGATSYVPWATYDKVLEIALLPNATWLFHAPKKSLSKNVVIVGNPDYGGELAQLQGTTKEAQALGKLYGVKPLLFKNATLQNITKHIAQGAKVLHLATHGVFYQDKPLDSAVFLSQDSTLYTLSAKEIFKTPLKADLVVLSACETGMGVNVAGDDLLGLPRSFFLGGTQAIVSSLWPIDDKGTKEFMLIFHKYAKDGAYEKGLLKAKEALKAKGYSPSVYGAFVLYGKSL